MRLQSQIDVSNTAVRIVGKAAGLQVAGVLIASDGAIRHVSALPRVYVLPKSVPISTAIARYWLFFLITGLNNVSQALECCFFTCDIPKIYQNTHPQEQVPVPCIDAYQTLLASHHHRLYQDGTRTRRSRLSVD